MTFLTEGLFAPAASIPVVGFNAVLMSEHFGSFLTFGILHGAFAIQYVKVPLSPTCVTKVRGRVYFGVIR